MSRSVEERIVIRPIAAADLAETNAIYNHYVLSSTATWRATPEPLEEHVAWVASHGAQHPVLVAEIDGRVVGWGALSQLQQSAAYAGTVEDSLWIHHDFRHRGLGRALLTELIVRARSIGHHTIIARVDSDQAASLALHQAHDFRRSPFCERSARSSAAGWMRCICSFFSRGAAKVSVESLRTPVLP